MNMKGTLFKRTNLRFADFGLPPQYQETYYPHKKSPLIVDIPKNGIQNFYCGEFERSIIFLFLFLIQFYVTVNLIPFLEPLVIDIGIDPRIPLFT
jgi:hypothetical protein